MIILAPIPRDLFTNQSVHQGWRLCTVHIDRAHTAWCKAHGVRRIVQCMEYSTAPTSLAGWFTSIPNNEPNQHSALQCTGTSKCRQRNHVILSSNCFLDAKKMCNLLFCIIFAFFTFSGSLFGLLAYFWVAAGVPFQEHQLLPFHHYHHTTQ